MDADLVGQRSEVGFRKDRFWDHLFLQSWDEEVLYETSESADDTKIASPVNTVKDIRSINDFRGKIGAKWILMLTSVE